VSHQAHTEGDAERVVSDRRRGARGQPIRDLPLSPFDDRIRMAAFAPFMVLRRLTATPIKPYRPSQSQNGTSR